MIIVQPLNPRLHTGQNRRESQDRRHRDAREEKEGKGKEGRIAKWGGRQGEAGQEGGHTEGKVYHPWKVETQSH